MDFINFLRSRRSIRRFKPLPVGKDVLVSIIETATYAPSAHNRQPWRFAIMTSKVSKRRLSEAMAVDFRRDLSADGVTQSEIDSRLNRSIDRLVNAPVVIILCLDMTEMDVYSDPRGNREAAERIMAIQSVAAAGVQLQLAARAEGLESVWTCSPLFASKTVKNTLDLPETWEPQAMMLMGYSDETPKEKKLKPLAEVVKYIE